MHKSHLLSPIQLVDSTDLQTRKFKNISDLYVETHQVDFETKDSCHYTSKEPNFVAEALGDHLWKKAIDEEFQVIEKNETWEFISPLKNYKPIELN